MELRTSQCKNSSPVTRRRSRSRTFQPSQTRILTLVCFHQTMMAFSYVQSARKTCRRQSHFTWSPSSCATANLTARKDRSTLSWCCKWAWISATCLPEKKKHDLALKLAAIKEWPVTDINFQLILRQVHMLSAELNQLMFSKTYLEHSFIWDAFK